MHGRPTLSIRTINMWDNLDGSTEYHGNCNWSWGNATMGRSIFHV
jgi:hypothetical protein